MSYDDRFNEQLRTDNNRFNELPRALNEDHMSVLFLIDTSGSMGGTPIRNAEAGVNGFRSFLAADQCRDCVDVCVMAFDDRPRVIADWAPVSVMRDISLDAGGTTALYDGVDEAIDKIRERSTVYTQLNITERKPYLIVLSDGYDNASCRDRASVVAHVSNRINGDKLKLFFLGYGDYDRSAAAALTSAGGTKRSLAFEVSGPDAPFSEFFDFVTNSVKAASTSAPGALIHVDTTIGTPGSRTKVVELDGWLNE